jgi:hypothetical protein
MSEPRLPSALEVSGLLRRVSTAGGFATVVARGEPDSGAILLVLLDRGGAGRLFERVPQASGERLWQCTREQGTMANQEFNELLTRRRAQDPDLWIVELDIPQGERFIGHTIAGD